MKSTYTASCTPATCTQLGATCGDQGDGCGNIINCGACSFNRKEMLGRILKAKAAGVPITNYGLTIAFSLGIFERALQPFPAAYEAYMAARRAGA